MIQLNHKFYLKECFFKLQLNPYLFHYKPSNQLENLSFYLTLNQDDHLPVKLISMKMLFDF